MCHDEKYVTEAEFVRRARYVRCSGKQIKCIRQVTVRIGEINAVEGCHETTGIYGKVIG